MPIYYDNEKVAGCVDLIRRMYDVGPAAEEVYVRRIRKRIEALKNEGVETSGLGELLDTTLIEKDWQLRREDISPARFIGRR